MLLCCFFLLFPTKHNGLVWSTLWTLASRCSVESVLLFFLCVKEIHVSIFCGSSRYVVEYIHSIIACNCQCSQCENSHTHDGDSIPIMCVHTLIQRTLINAIIPHVLTLSTSIKLLSIRLATNFVCNMAKVLATSMLIGFPLISFFPALTNVSITYKW